MTTPPPGRPGARPARLCVAGFSLVELLVAVALLALASAMAWTGLASVTDSRARLAAEQQRFAGIERSVAFFAHDLGTAVDRPVRVGAAARQAALVGDAHRVALTRIGVASELKSASSDLERVVWFVDDEKLVRGRYQALDRADARTLRPRALANGVEQLELRYLDRAGVWHANWPPDRRLGVAPAGLPRAVEFRIDFDAVGAIRRVIELPAAVPVPSLHGGPGP